MNIIYLRLAVKFFLQDALEFMSVIAVMVNCALVGFSGLADRLWPDMTTTERIVFIVILEVCQSRVHIITPQNEVWGKVMFLYLCVILFTGRGLASQHASQVT